MPIKYLLIAIILGGISGNLLCIIEAISGNPLVPDFGILVLLISSILTCLIYFLFMREKKTVYALACIPSAVWFMVGMIDFWGKVFHISENSRNFFAAGTGILYYAVLFMCVIMVLATLLIRWVLIKLEKLLDFEKTEEGYCTHLRSLSFICAGKDKNYKKSVRILTDAYYQGKEKEIIAYIIRQEDFIQAYGKMTEEEMLEKIEEMPFFPEIFLHAEMHRTLTFYDEIYVIKLSFEEIFENLCDMSIRKPS